MTTFNDLEKKVLALEERVKKLEEINALPTSSGDKVLMDELYRKAKALVIKYDKATAIFLQRKLYIDYQRATQLLEELEKNGVVGPAIGIVPRAVLHKE